jgi:hypothetical protein
MIPTIIEAIANLRAVEDARPCPFVLTICLPMKNLHYQR